MNQAGSVLPSEHWGHAGSPTSFLLRCQVPQVYWPLSATSAPLLRTQKTFSTLPHYFRDEETWWLWAVNSSLFKKTTLPFLIYWDSVGTEGLRSFLFSRASPKSKAQVPVLWNFPQTYLGFPLSNLCQELIPGSMGSFLQHPPALIIALPVDLLPPTDWTYVSFWAVKVVTIYLLKK